MFRFGSEREFLLISLIITGVMFMVQFVPDSLAKWSIGSIIFYHIQVEFFPT